MVTRVPALSLIPLGVLLLCVVIVGDALAGPASVATPTEELRRHVDHVVRTAQSPRFRALGPVERRDAIRRMNERIFDWPDMARRALGAHWDGRTGGERQAFAGWFARLAERAYMAQVEQVSANGLRREPLRFLGERVAGDDAIVHAALGSPRELPVDFRLHRRDGRWRVYDVAVDGVSAAENYGAQFRRVIGRASYPRLVDRMLAKLGDAPAEPVVAAARP